MAKSRKLPGARSALRTTDMASAPGPHAHKASRWRGSGVSKGVGANWPVFGGNHSESGGGDANWQIYSGEIIPSSSLW